ncbi:MAG: hypothetical protein ACR2IR_12525 [Acidimicrobiia bacterium]
MPLTIIRQPENLGYGGNQKAAYHWAMEHDLDVVVLLHGDGQYAPEVLPDWSSRSSSTSAMRSSTYAQVRRAANPIANTIKTMTRRPMPPKEPRSRWLTYVRPGRSSEG